jgi:transcriptional regulator with XRE-family HTH domain
MQKGIFTDSFTEALNELLEHSGVSRYQIAQYTGIDEGYLCRLVKGEKSNPSPGIVARICLAIAHYSDKVSQHDFEKLFNSLGRSLLIKH